MPLILSREARQTRCWEASCSSVSSHSTRPGPFSLCAQTPEAVAHTLFFSFLTLETPLLKKKKKINPLWV